MKMTREWNWRSWEMCRNGYEKFIAGKWMFRYKTHWLRGVILEKMHKIMSYIINLSFVVFIYSKNDEIFWISEYGVGLINFQKLKSSETNNNFCRKIITTQISKYANLVKAFSRNQIPHECNLWNEELFAYHEHQFFLLVKSF